MLIGNFDKSLVCSEAVASLFKNGHIGSFFAFITKPIVINVEPLFLIRMAENLFNLTDIKTTKILTCP